VCWNEVRVMSHSIFREIFSSKFQFQFQERESKK
jgi:hypothetical protein